MNDMMDEQTLNFLGLGFQFLLAHHIYSVLLVFNFMTQPTGVYGGHAPKV